MYLSLLILDNFTNKIFNKLLLIFDIWYIHKYTANKGNCFLYVLFYSDTSRSSTPSAPLSYSGSSLSVLSSGSDSDLSRQPKRMKIDEEPLQSALAKDVSLSSEVCNGY